MSEANTTTGLKSYGTVEKNTKELFGEVLTVIDAAIPSDKQNKAVKDTVRKFFKSYLGRIQGDFSYIDRDENGATWGSSSDIEYGSEEKN